MALSRRGLAAALRIATLGVFVLAPAAIRAGDAQDCAIAEYLVRTDPERAVSACRRLAEAGLPQAQHSLAHMYAFGIGVPKDFTIAAQWYLKSAEQGVIGSQMALVYMYGFGLGVPQDEIEQFKWALRAANQGDPNSQWHLGFVYRDGELVPQDLVKSYMWFTIAMERLTESDSRHAEVGREMTAEQMSPAQIEEAARLARQWQPTPELPD